MFKVKDIFTWGFKAAQGIAVDLYKLSHEDIPSITFISRPILTRFSSICARFRA